MAKFLDLSDVLQDFSKELSESVTKPNVYGYKPYPKQERAHRSQKYGRLILGGNRAGKTDWNVVEMIWWLCGIHPYRSTPPTPIMGRCIVVDIVKGIDKIMLPKLKRWMPKEYLIDGSWDKSWDDRRKTLTLTNGSELDFLTYEMDMDKHGGVPRHFISFDEEPPQHIFNEAMQRLMDYDGSWWASMTPLSGFTWMHEMLYEPVENDPSGQIAQDLDIFEMSQEDNPYLKAQDRGRFYIGASDEERESREHGKFVSASGQVFPYFEKPKYTHVLPDSSGFVPPKSWEWYMSIDVGWNNPTAILWHAVSPENVIVTFSEVYENKETLAHYAETIRMREAMWGREPDLRTGDPAMKQTSIQTGVSVLQMFGDLGIYLSVDRVPHDVETGLIKMHDYLMPNKFTNKPRWFITENCVNFIREMKGLRFESFASRKMQFDQNRKETVHKKHDHTFDSARYFATFLPDLRPDEASREPVIPIGQAKQSESYVTVMSRLSEEQSTADQWDVELSYDY